MVPYTSNLEIRDRAYGRDELNFQEFEECRFVGCDFSAGHFMGVTFVDCTFEGCRFSGAGLNHTAFRTVHFIGCAMTGLNFAMADKLIFEIHFKDCVLDFSKFYGLRMNAATFTGCSLIAVDFMAADLENVLFDGCDLYRAEFDKANATRCDFRTSRHYTIVPERTKLKKAIISRDGLGGLVKGYGVEVVDASGFSIT